MSHEEIIDYLIRMVEKEQQTHIRSAAVAALGGIGTERCINVLISLLSHKEWETRGSAAWSLGYAKDKKVLPKLKNALKKEKNDYVKGQLEDAIEQLKALEEK